MHFTGQTLRDFSRAEIELTGVWLRTGEGSKVASGLSAGRDRKANAGKTKPRIAGLCFFRSGARRSQEQGESRMTVLPGARNRESGWQMMRFAMAAPQPWGRYLQRRRELVVTKSGCCVGVPTAADAQRQAAI